MAAFCEYVERHPAIAQVPTICLVKLFLISVVWLWINFGDDLAGFDDVCLNRYKTYRNVSAESFYSQFARMIIPNVFLPTPTLMRNPYGEGCAFECYNWHIFMQIGFESSMYYLMG